MPTAVEIAIMRGAPMSLGVLRQVQAAVPLFSGFDMRTTAATHFRTLVISALPDVNPFRNLGDGFLSGKATLTLRKFDCSYMGGLVVAQSDVARVWNEENQEIDFDYFTLQASTRIQADLLKVEKQMVYGTAINPQGFPGLKQMTPGNISANVLSLTETAEDTDYTKTVINAGGSTSNTGSSVYSVRFGQLDCQLVMGGTSAGAELFEFGERRIQSIAPDASKPNELAEHEIAQYSGHIGLSVAGFSGTEGAQVPSQYALRRLTNLTAQTDCGLDDTKMQKLLDSHPATHRPSVFVMNGRSGDQWATSRRSTGSVTFVGNMGSGRDGVINRAPPRPTEFDGIPVIYTPAIKSTDIIDVPA